MSKTINQALADLVTGLGESSSILSDNMTVSDYIADVETAIKDYAGVTAEAIIDDSVASETKTYSSSKIESLIPENELPAVSATDNGKVLGVSGGAWGKRNPYIDIGDAMIDKLFLTQDTAKSILSDGCGTFTQDDIKYFAFLSTVSGNNVTFLSVSRGTNSTVYKSFTFDKTISTTTQVPITTVTVNDPT